MQLAGWQLAGWQVGRLTVPLLYLLPNLSYPMQELGLAQKPNTTHYTLHNCSLKCTLPLHTSLNTAPCTVHTSHCTLHTVHYTLQTTHLVMCTSQRTLRQSHCTNETLNLTCNLSWLYGYYPCEIFILCIICHWVYSVIVAILCFFG